MNTEHGMPAGSGLGGATSDLDLRPEVMAFAQLMEGRLRKHDAEKGLSWKQMSLSDLCVQVTSKSFRLEDAIRYGFYDEMLKHAIDTANYCMMIDDVAGAFRNKEAAP
jgi:hypothetical protein